jgi:hypothetical protein
MRIWSACINSFFGLCLTGWTLMAVEPTPGGGSETKGGEAKAPAKVEATAKAKDKPTKEEKDPSKVASTIRLHMETESPGMGSGKIKVMRSDPTTLNVEKNAFVDEGFLERADVIETVGGHMILLKFNTQGALRLQMWTVSKTGRRIAVWAKWTEGRWIAAPVAARALEDGVIAFTPDASREEAERIVRGLNNVAIKLGNQKKPAKQKQPTIGGKSGKKSKDGTAAEESMFEK